MGRIRSKNTRLERDFKARIDALGITGYVQHSGKFHPDFSWPNRKVAVFLDSCFWHGCLRHFVPPKTNIEFWEDKMIRTKTRDSKADAELKTDGWTIFRIWEHDVDLFNVGDIVNAVGIPPDQNGLQIKNQN